MVSEAVTYVVLGLLFLGFLAWIFLMLYWILGKFGLWKRATYRRLKKRYKDLEFDDATLDWCLDKLERRWRFKDVKRFLKYEKNSGEILYTYMVLSKLPKEELNTLIERRSLNGQENRRIKEETSRSLPEFPRESTKGFGIS